MLHIVEKPFGRRCYTYLFLGYPFWFSFLFFLLNRAHRPALKHMLLVILSSGKKAAGFCWCSDVWKCQGLAYCPLMYLPPNCSARFSSAVYTVSSSHHRAAAQATTDSAAEQFTLFAPFPSQALLCRLIWFSFSSDVNKQTPPLTSTSPSVPFPLTFSSSCAPSSSSIATPRSLPLPTGTNVICSLLLFWKQKHDDNSNNNNNNNNNNNSSW